MNLRSVIELFLADRKSRDCNAGTVQNYRSQLGLFLTWLDGVGVRESSELTCDVLTRYLDSLREREQLRRTGKLSPVTIHKRAKHLKTFIIWMTRRDYVSKELVLSFPMPKVRKRLPKFLKQEEINLLWSAKMSARDRAIIAIMLDSGLRLSEVSDLVLDDLDFLQGMIHVRHGKGDKERYTLFGDSAKHFLRSWVDERKSNTDSVFVDEFGAPLKAGGIYKVVRRVARSVGLKIYPHQLRHTFATEFLNADGSPTDLQKLMGHNDINTTMIYARVSLGAIRKRFAGLSLVNRFGDGQKKISEDSTSEGG